jgi:hypothetical protein
MDIFLAVKKKNGHGAILGRADELCLLQGDLELKAQICVSWQKGASH